MPDRHVDALSQSPQFLRLPATVDSVGIEALILFLCVRSEFPFAMPSRNGARQPRPALSHWGMGFTIGFNSGVRSLPAQQAAPSFNGTGKQQISHPNRHHQSLAT